MAIDIEHWFKKVKRSKGHHVSRMQVPPNTMQELLEELKALRPAPKPVEEEYEEDDT